MFNFSVVRGVLVISAQDTEQTERFEVPGEDDVAGETYGVYGIVEHGDARCLAIVCSARFTGMVGGHPVLESTRVLVFALGPRCETLCKRLREFFALPGLFFSTYALHRRMKDNTKEGEGPAPGVAECKPNEFLFNSHPLQIYKKGHRYFTLSCIQGYFGSHKGLTLISRRSSQRTGTRFFSRGCDANGNCSNFVETEQIWNGESAYLQLRGSIPLFWGHSVGWRYNPPVVFRYGGAGLVGGARKEMDAEESKAERVLSGFEKAHSLLKSKYKEEIIYLNLVGEEGYEGALCSAFNWALSGLRGFHYDFHKNIGKKEFPFDFRETGFTSAAGQQKAVVRTNCIDCLDRTNSMQFMIGLQILEDQMRDGTDLADPCLEDYRSAFKRLYYENGNYLSLQYAGTPALLARHILGRGNSRCRFFLFFLLFHPALHHLSLSKLQDGLFSAKRYLLNRLCHGRLQNTYEIMTGLRNGGALVDTERRTMAALWGFCFCTLISQLRGIDSVFDAAIILVALCVFLYGFMANILDIPVA